MKPIDIIEDLRLEVTASIDSREQGYVDDLFRKATDALISSSTASVPDYEELAEKLHGWYLEACKELNPESFNPNAQKSYLDLTEEQKFIDRYIAKKCIALLTGGKDSQ